MKSLSAVGNGLECQELLASLNYWVTFDGHSFNLVELYKARSALQDEKEEPAITAVLMSTLEKMKGIENDYTLWVRQRGRSDGHQSAEQQQLAEEQQSTEVQPTESKEAEQQKEQHKEVEQKEAEQREAAGKRLEARLASDQDFQVEVLKPLAQLFMAAQFSIQTRGKGSQKEGSQKEGSQKEGSQKEGSQKEVRGFPGLSEKDVETINQWNCDYASAFSSAKTASGNLATELVCSSMDELVAVFSTAEVSIDKGALIMPGTPTTSSMTANTSILTGAGKSQSSWRAAQQFIPQLPKAANNPFAQPRTLRGREPRARAA
ncbi:hypothetical protein GNI_171060 [Gregarina niphandrodes]|uniref:Uncharacterized protein n=1 Tax=Gregarina niphandrodes TaxID=110365 RepID=A0A023AXV2_GRENI|nr:hypothetical protein GNI_171060 [Gregarina niphandrodes]EZG43464.1 hypothetical protein GNI_171060 [Gregarina niphandrodes]|eukprot:XP_011133315.1 hypothetical protein GNI_171060 [Gregarina niphandrodes]